MVRFSNPNCSTERRAGSAVGASFSHSKRIVAHVFDHHSKLGEDTSDPDLRYMLAEGVYDEQSRSSFIIRFVVAPLIGGRTIKYLRFLIGDRLAVPLASAGERWEPGAVVSFHASILVVSYYVDVLWVVLLFWWLPLLLVHPVIGWFSELAEHFPLMKRNSEETPFGSRNRYPAFVEALFIGIHGDNFHLTHHLLPGIPHWNLKKATRILREDRQFSEWDAAWGGIFSSSAKGRVSLLSYIVNHHRFRPDQSHALVSSIAEFAA